MKLESVTILNSETVLGRACFDDCYNLEKVNIPSKLKNIFGHTFANCRCLKEIVLPKDLKSIGDFAFFDCESLKYIIIPRSVTSIGESAFTWCKKIEGIHYSGSLEEWKKVDIKDEYNHVRCFIYSEEKPIEKGDYWHYDLNGLPVKW